MFGSKLESFKGVVEQLKPERVAYLGLDPEMRTVANAEGEADLIFVDGLLTESPEAVLEGLQIATRDLRDGGFVMGSDWDKVNVQRTLADYFSLMRVLVFPGDVWMVRT